MTKILSCILALFLLASCSDSSSNARDEHKKSSQYKIAIILPLDKGNKRHWDRTVQIFSRNLAEAFDLSSQDSTFLFDIEWIDENTANLDSAGKSLSRRKDILAVIGPLQSRNLESIAEYFSRETKTLIAPMVTSAEAVRKFASQRWFFSLSETDLTQIEMLIQQAVAFNATSISLLAANTRYGATFLDWFAFLATEQGLKVGGIYPYEDSLQFEEATAQAFKNEKDFMVCVPDSYGEVPRFMAAYKKSRSTARILFSDAAYDPNLLTLEGVEGVKGIALSFDPESGFENTYIAHFGESPIVGEAQLYDALMLCAFAQARLRNDSSETFYEALANIATYEDGADEFYAWEAFPMSRVLDCVARGESLCGNIKGASGSLGFDLDRSSVVRQSVYAYWMVSGKKFHHLEYYSREGSRRVTQANVSISWYSKNYEQVFDSAANFNYPPLRGQYALLVASSRGWINYRHQADVFRMYRKLKSLGMEAERIILIAENDLMYNFLNPYPGELRDYEGNVISDSVQVDYVTSEINPEDIYSILAGKKSKRLPKVVEGDSATNVFVFWSGHGSPGYLKWAKDSTEAEFTLGMMEDILLKLSEERKHRKMLWLVESCYSGSLCKAFDMANTRGSLCISAASEFETSKAELYSGDLRTYTTNSFTRNIMEAIRPMGKDESYSVNLFDLYMGTSKNTLGSHVSIFNASNFDNLYISRIDEFLIPPAGLD